LIKERVKPGVLKLKKALDVAPLQVTLGLELISPFEYIYILESFDLGHRPIAEKPDVWKHVDVGHPVRFFNTDFLHHDEQS